MDLDKAKQEVLDHLNFGQAGSDALVGLKAGVAAGAAIGTSIGSILPVVGSSLGGAAGTMYGAVVGSGIGFLHGLFIEDPAVARKRAREKWQSMTNASSALETMFKTWPPTARDVFVQTPMYARLVSATFGGDKYRDPLAILDNVDAREAFREGLRKATVSPLYPEGIVFGDVAIKAQVAERLKRLGLDAGALGKKGSLLPWLLGGAVVATGGAVYIGTRKGSA